MGGIFGAPKIPKPPRPVPPVTEAQADQAGDAAMKEQRRKSGFEQAFTGNLTPKTPKKMTLG